MERKEAIEVIKKNWPDSSFTMLREALETLIPELKSDDEKIRKVLVDYFKRYKEQEECGIKTFFGIPTDNIITWLEKQGEQKLVEKYNITGIGSKNAQGRLGKMIKNLKSADKVEPKFHEGDWVVYECGEETATLQITRIVEETYVFSDDSTLGVVDEDTLRLWDVTQDAKDGDVLAIEPENGYHSPFIAIYKERGLDFFNSHCFISFDGKFNEGTTGHSIYHVHPATKEQRDALEKAMADAGWEFDFEKKELKKIEQQPTDVRTTGYWHVEDINQKSAWSEEDEKLIDTIISDLERHGGKESSCYSSEINYLKSLKDRISPKQEWSEEDEVCLANVMWAIKQARAIAKDENDMGNLWYAERWIKSLRPQNTWKPSEELITYLYEAIDIIEEQEKYSIVTALRELLEQLKQL